MSKENTFMGNRKRYPPSPNEGRPDIQTKFFTADTWHNELNSHADCAHAT